MIFQASSMVIRIWMCSLHRRLECCGISRLVRWKPGETEGQMLVDKGVNGVVVSPQGQNYLLDRHNDCLLLYEKDSLPGDGPAQVVAQTEGCWSAEPPIITS